MKFNFKEMNPKSLIGIAGAVVAGVIAFSSEIASQKKEKEFEELKNDVAELKKQHESS